MFDSAAQWGKGWGATRNRAEWVWQENDRLIVLRHRENDRKSFFPLALIATVEFDRGRLPNEHPTPHIC